jgi:hypothetical protein
MVHDDRVPLPPGHQSLAHGGAEPVPGGLLALSAAGGIRVLPAEGRSVYFGRNFPEVDVGIGVADRRVSRRQGVLTHRDGRWWVTNTGNRPIRLPDSRWLLRGGGELPLATGYTPLFVPGSGAREHLLELYVAGPRPSPALMSWPLTPDERLTMIMVGQRYLRHEANPRPLTWAEAAGRLALLQPGRWWEGRLPQLVGAVARRLSDQGVIGLAGDEAVANLLRELVRTGTLVPPDLALLDRSRPGADG